MSTFEATVYRFQVIESLSTSANANLSDTGAFQIATSFTITRLLPNVY